MQSETRTNGRCVARFVDDRFHCHAIKFKSKTMEWKKPIKSDVIEDK